MRVRCGQNMELLQLISSDDDISVYKASPHRTTPYLTLSSNFIISQVPEHTIALILLFASLREDKTAINHTCCCAIITPTSRNPDVGTPMKVSVSPPQIIFIKKRHPVSTSTGSVMPPSPIVTSMVYTIALFWLITPVKLADELRG